MAMINLKAKSKVADFHGSIVAPGQDGRWYVVCDFADRPWQWLWSFPSEAAAWKWLGSPVNPDEEGNDFQSDALFESLGGKRPRECPGR